MHPARAGRRTPPATAGLLALLNCLFVSPSGEACEPPEVGARPLIEVVATPVKNGERLRVEALVTTDRVRRVDFLFDGELVETDRRFPFGAVVPAPLLEGASSPANLEGVAFDDEDREIGRDTVELGGRREPIRLSLSGVDRIDGGDWLEVAALVHHAEDVAIDRVDFYRDGRYVASTGTQPYRVRIRGGATNGYLRAVALSRDGTVAEQVLLLDDRAPADQLSVSLVEIYAMVTTRAGQPVTGLAADQFELRRDGLPLEIERFAEGDDVPLSIALLIDGSGSMLDDMARAKRSAGDFLIASLDAGDRALLLDFDTRPHLLHELTDDVEGLVERFDDIDSAGASAIYDAILFAALQLESSTGRRALVVVTDGLDTGSRISARDCAVAARRLGVPIFVLNLEESYARPPSDRRLHRRLELRDLAQTSGGGFYPVRRPADVASAYEAITTQLRGQYLLGFSSHEPLSSAQLESITLEVANERLTVRTILGGELRLFD